MDKKSLSIGVIVLVVLALGAWFMANRRAGDQRQPSGSQESATISLEEGNATTPTSLKALLASGSAQQCSFRDTTAGMDSEGVIYVAGGKVRGNFTSTVDGQPLGAHMIVDGQTSYVWTDGSTTGFTTTVSAAPTTPPSAASSQTASLDVNKTLDYSCQPWAVDASVFTLPTGVQFTDLSALTTGVAP